MVEKTTLAIQRVFYYNYVIERFTKTTMSKESEKISFAFMQHSISAITVKDKPRPH